ncbi:MAG: hypothetical protein WC450_11970 [Candidatus Omnitrophota bacterium]|jgi:hypothetical protein
MSDDNVQEIREMFVGNLVECVDGGCAGVVKGCAELGVDGKHLWMVFHDGSGAGIENWVLQDRSLRGETPNRKERSFAVVGGKYSMLIMVDGRSVARPVIEVCTRAMDGGRAAARLRGTSIWKAADTHHEAVAQLLVTLGGAWKYSAKWQDYEVLLLPPDQYF